MTDIKFLWRVAPALGFFLCSVQWMSAQELYRFPSNGEQSRSVSPENPAGEKGKAGKVNKGAKGEAFFMIAPGEKKVIFNVEGTGIIKRIWISGTPPVEKEQRRAVRIDMFWDHADKPAVSAPLCDFFGESLGLLSSFENDFFASPEGRSFNCTIPMPYRTAAKMIISNESHSYVLLWYDVDFITVASQPDDLLYFHAYWNRLTQTQLGKDYEILPRVSGRGRYLGANIGVICNADYKHSWFGEGEVKMYLDGDTDLPTIAGTGTEDYIGSGWGQGVFVGPYHGSLVADTSHQLYAFYRYHIRDPIYFYSDCRVTIQQIGSASLSDLRDMISHHAKLQPVWYFNSKGMNDESGDRSKGPEQTRLLDGEAGGGLDRAPKGASVNYYRSDDVSATAYFYLDKPESDLPPLPALSLRMQDIQAKVWDRINSRKK
jgi:hypothetical protein